MSFFLLRAMKHRHLFRTPYRRVGTRGHGGDTWGNVSRHAMWQGTCMGHFWGKFEIT